jgi:hypothetical protein
LIGVDLKRHGTDDASQILTRPERRFRPVLFGTPRAEPTRFRVALVVETNESPHVPLIPDSEDNPGILPRYPRSTQARIAISGPGNILVNRAILLNLYVKTGL